MNKQNIIILSILAIGSLSSIAYATSTVITDSGITTNNLTVTGSCTGCGGDGQYTHWTLFSNTVITDTNAYNSSSSDIKVGNNGNSIIYTGDTSEGNVVQIFFPNGTQYENTIAEPTAHLIYSRVFDESDGGHYQVIGTKFNDFTGNLHHIQIYTDVNDSAGAHQRLVILQGS